MKKEYVIYGLLGIIIIGLVILCVLFANGTIVLKKTSKETTTTTTTTKNIHEGLGDKDTFSYSKEVGIVEVIGYPYVKHFEADEFTDEEADYVYFYITETKSNDFIKYVKGLEGNAFADKNAIGIGCLKDGIINFFSLDDESFERDESYTYEFSKDDTNAIMNATKENPIRLKMTKNKFTAGVGISTWCYSHMNTIEIVK